MNDIRNVFKRDDEVVLRPVEKSDAEFLHELVQHSEVRGTLGRPPKPLSLKEEKDYIENLSSNEDIAYFIIEHKKESAGSISLHGLEDEYRRGEFGISIHPDYQNQGLGTKSVKMLLEYAFDAQNLHKVRAGFLEGNIGSKKIMEKEGMKREGQERHYKYVDGAWKDMIWMSLLESEHSTLRED